MNIEVKWDGDNHHLIVWEMTPGFLWEEFNTAVDESVALMATVPNRVDLMVLTHGALLPTADAMAPFRRSVTQHLVNHNGGYLIIVGGGRIVPVLMNFLKGSIPKDMLTFLDVKFFNVEEQARAFIAKNPG